MTTAPLDTQSAIRLQSIKIDPMHLGEIPEISVAYAFAMHIEIACEDFELLQDIIRGDIRLISNFDIHANPDLNEDRKKKFRSSRASPRIEMALAKSFLFNARRANRILSRNKSKVNISRSERKNFIKEIDKLTPIRDVNEHGFDGNGTKPSLHNLGGGRLDETSMIINGPDRIHMGPVNLFDYYRLVSHMREIAGFLALAE